MEETVKTEEKLKGSNLFKSGDEWTGNANGRPKGSFSIKTKIIKRLEENPEQLDKVIEHLLEKEQALLWQMIDGRPKQDSDLNVQGELNLGVVMLPPKNENTLDTTTEAGNSTV